MAKTNQFTAEEIIQALQESQGLPALAAEKLGCTAQTVYNYRDRYKSVAEAMHHQKEKRLDFAEGKLWQNINNNDTASIIFFLKTQGKSRGYIERQEHSGPDGGPVEFKNMDDANERILGKLDRLAARARTSGSIKRDSADGEGQGSA